jgi:membrane-associated protein
MNALAGASTPPATGVARGALLAAGLVAAAAFAAVTAGFVQPPDLEALLTRLSSTFGTWTYALVAGLAFLETGAFVGLVAPGETAIVLGGVVAAEGQVSLAVILPLAGIAAALGDLVSFWLGKRLGRRFLLAHGPRLGVTATRLEQVEGFFERHGPKAILAGRFIGIVRAVAPFLAGASGMPLRAFLPWSLIGTAVWATTFTLVGYAFHHSFGAAADALTHRALAVAVLAAAALAWRQHRRSARPRRAAPGPRPASRACAAPPPPSGGRARA